MKRMLIATGHENRSDQPRLILRDSGRTGEKIVGAALCGILLVAIHLGCLTASAGKAGKPTGSSVAKGSAGTGESQGTVTPASKDSAQATDSKKAPDTSTGSQSPATQSAAPSSSGAAAQSGSSVDQEKGGSKTSHATGVTPAGAMVLQTDGSRTEPGSEKPSTAGARGITAGGGASGSGGASDGKTGSEESKDAILLLSLRASPAEVDTGELFVAEVLTSAPVPVVDMPLTFKYDPALLQFLDASQGDFLAQDGGSVVFLANGAARPGEVIIGMGRTDRTHGIAGRGTLCRIRFRALAGGEASLHLTDAQAWGERGTALRVDSNSAVVTIKAQRSP